jgi:hypothetical protein
MNRWTLILIVAAIALSLLFAGYRLGVAYVNQLVGW